ncbi:potassium-transporting ATPase subunit F [Criblamydia sequanensis]|uniref:K+-transporting ATPase, F subunit n=1 Tax=Candidatus Criblamydia sequanensis CRIB-18 TaxID=1437425 RepID=A0A090CZ00_9BACT|nr:K+-transporting ATPase, F subunit [Criblamydia sequanensis CRIB-18]
MGNEFFWAGLASVLVIFYLTYTLLYPEKF